MAPTIKPAIRGTEPRRARFTSVAAKCNSIVCTLELLFDHLPTDHHQRLHFTLFKPKNKIESRCRNGSKWNFLRKCRHAIIDPTKMTNFTSSADEHHNHIILAVFGRDINNGGFPPVVNPYLFQFNNLFSPTLLQLQTWSQEAHQLAYLYTTDHSQNFSPLKITPIQFHDACEISETWTSEYTGTLRSTKTCCEWSACRLIVGIFDGEETQKNVYHLLMVLRHLSRAELHLLTFMAETEEDAKNPCMNDNDMITRNLIIKSNVE